jgi:hypothetical protein
MTSRIGRMRDVESDGRRIGSKGNVVSTNVAMRRMSDQRI